MASRLQARSHDRAMKTKFAASGTSRAEDAQLLHRGPGGNRDEQEQRQKAGRRARRGCGDEDWLPPRRIGNDSRFVASHEDPLYTRQTADTRLGTRCQHRSGDR